MRPQLSPIVAEVRLSEADIVDADNTINWPMLNAIADRRARREQQACAKIGWLRDLSVLIAEEVAVLERTAAVMIECRQARAIIERMPPREQLIRSLEFRLAKLRHGLGMPYDADAVARCESLLEQAARRPRAGAGRCSEADMSDRPLGSAILSLLVAADQRCPAIIGQAHLIYYTRFNARRDERQGPPRGLRAIEARRRGPDGGGSGGRGRDDGPRERDRRSGAERHRRTHQDGGV